MAKFASHPSRNTPTTAAWHISLATEGAAFSVVVISAEASAARIQPPNRNMRHFLPCLSPSRKFIVQIVARLFLVLKVLERFHMLSPSPSACRRSLKASMPSSGTSWTSSVVASVTATSFWPKAWTPGRGRDAPPTVFTSNIRHLPKRGRPVITIQRLSPPIAKATSWFAASGTLEQEKSAAEELIASATTAAYHTATPAPSHRARDQ